MLEYDNLSNLVIQYEFKEPETLFNHLINTLNKNIQDIYKIKFVKENENVVTKYKEISLEDTNNITTKIFGIFEKGIIFTLSCHANSFGKDLDIPTEALLIIEKGKDPIYIISKIDNSYVENQQLNGTAHYGNQLIDCNEDIIKLKEKQLGNRIDINQVKVKEDDNIFNKKKNEKIRILFSEKIRLIVVGYVNYMNEIQISKTKKK